MNLIVEKIISSVILIFPDGGKKRYESGVAAIEHAFEKYYRISSLKAVGDEMEITLFEQNTPAINWTGED